MATISDYGSWHSNIDADIIVSGNCKAICELQATNESVFWIEQLFLDGRRCIFESRCVIASCKRLVAVHEYGGGSFIVVDGSVLFVTTTGIYRQQSADSAPEVIFEGGSSRRFADLFYSGLVVRLCASGHLKWSYGGALSSTFSGCAERARKVGNLYVVEEVHSNESHFPQNRISRISSSGDVEPFVSGADFYAWPRVSPDGKYFSWMQWNLPFMRLLHKRVVSYLAGAHTSENVDAHWLQPFTVGLSQFLRRVLRAVRRQQFLSLQRKTIARTKVRFRC
uniref:Uncharacterized protein n=1 Tax=Parascaris equorum TaxID=6256 RepID=A0A914RDP8_PAREQ